ncbi:MAG: glycosyltransferase [Flavobacteriaceae bacterium]|nr:glycosyltransferase [Flavobacteriaceae bacterium]
MKILVTVGTTRFDSLIQYLDTHLSSKYEVTMQIASGKYIPKRFPFIEFTPEIAKYYLNSDIIITHAGAGTIYKLLRMKKKILIVPNSERVDDHQLEIAEYMKNGNYALSINDFSELESSIEKVYSSNFNHYTSEQFFKSEELAHFIEETLK